MDQSRILIVGSNGQLGRALQAIYPDAQALDSEGLDITDAQAIQSFDWSDTSIILNAAAYTNVDGAETSKGRIAAWQVNAVGAANIAELATERNLTLVHISTEYVFDGTQNPHREEEPLSPLSVYAASKAAAEVAARLVPQHYLLRTSWVVGDGKNFVRTMLNVGQKGITPTVVADQIGRPTFADELARCIDHLLTAKPEFGTYNISGGGDQVSWADLTREIFKLAGFELDVTDITTAEYFADKPEAAKRPLQSTFDLAKIKATGFIPHDWREDLANYIAKEKQS